MTGAARTAVLGMPRIGAGRSLKRALEAYWAGTIPAEELQRTASEIRQHNWQQLAAASIDFVPSNDFSLYDHILDTAVMIGAIPDRFRPADGAFDLDDVVPRRLGERWGFEAVVPPMVLEGGSIDVDGAGTLLTTEACLLNPNRNPTLDRAGIESLLKYWLGVSSVLWLGEGIAGDDTVVTVVEDDPRDENHRVLADNLKRLTTMRDAQGRALAVETLPMPPAIFHEGTRMPASYANFYILNGGVIVPTFDCPQDAAAIATLGRLFPGRRVVGIPSRDLVWGLGAIHCLTQQHPAPPTDSA